MTARAIRALPVFLVLALLPFSLSGRADGPSATSNLKIFSQTLHEGRISPMLYGGFVELLDDLVPGMWAEMLGDRGFEGVLPTSTWDYFRGEPNLCDRDWNKSPDWSYDAEQPFNDKRSCLVDVPKGRPARLTQSNLAVHRGMVYVFSGYGRSDSSY